MRSKLLLSTAALLAGVALASAQNIPGGGQPGGATQDRQSQSPQGSPAQQGQKDKQGQAQGQKDQSQPQRGQKDQTTGQAPAKEGQDKAQPQRDQKAQGKEGQQDKAQPQRGQRDQTTGQSKQDQSPGQTQQRQQQGPTQGQAPQRQQDQQGQKGQQGQAQPGGQTGGSVTLTTEQRTKIRETVLVSGPKVTNVNFSISVGTVVPTSVRVVAVPAVLIEIHPEWSGFMYFVVGDQIIIVDRNHRIVAVLSV
jgi:hypothetical protein